ncbi:hypothetical protein MJO28_013977 [Puccinia striiformis f. sp. tritici]|uniref:Uncharacterized protein n=3 Tax=Puccinia striiformis f. sp. tritici TaxID=168172 RepID=A0A0L0W1F5_9BASI|nr:hypothetical protein Pst134EB_026147 [Puccinia striiformis f. sp. tritici]KAI7940325.1 hypothetical protein MJO28_013977 [Puccinia striiformis f. sp. tritici]KAI9613061.1 hypothetical protein H4Q26_010336 [Puccinia striiformis f. sp. tritici PST-130]KNF05080.1 hypothetical protein PSTG_01712 [Puccinia striiformis f. sp. tritici PST-78]
MGSSAHDDDEEILDYKFPDPTQLINSPSNSSPAASQSRTGSDLGGWSMVSKHEQTSNNEEGEQPIAVSISNEQQAETEEAEANDQEERPIAIAISNEQQTETEEPEQNDQAEQPIAIPNEQPTQTQEPETEETEQNDQAEQLIVIFNEQQTVTEEPEPEKCQKWIQDQLTTTASSIISSIDREAHSEIIHSNTSELEPNDSASQCVYHRLENYFDSSSSRISDVQPSIQNIHALPSPISPIIQKTEEEEEELDPAMDLSSAYLEPPQLLIKHTPPTQVTTPTPSLANLAASQPPSVSPSPQPEHPTTPLRQNEDSLVETSPKHEPINTPTSQNQYPSVEASPKHKPSTTPSPQDEDSVVGNSPKHEPLTTPSPQDEDSVVGKKSLPETPASKISRPTHSIKDWLFFLVCLLGISISYCYYGPGYSLILSPISPPGSDRFVEIIKNDDQDIIDIDKVNNVPSHLDEEDNLSPTPILNGIDSIIPEEANIEEENLNNPLSDNDDLNQPLVIPKDVPTEDHQSQLFLDEPALNDLDRPLDIEQQQPMTIISTSDDFLDSAKIIGDPDRRLIESESSGSLDQTHPDDYHQLPGSSPSSSPNPSSVFDTKDEDLSHFEVNQSGSESSSSDLMSTTDPSMLWIYILLGSFPFIYKIVFASSKHEPSNSSTESFSADHLIEVLECDGTTNNKTTPSSLSKEKEYTVQDFQICLDTISQNPKELNKLKNAVQKRIRNQVSSPKLEFGLLAWIQAITGDFVASESSWNKFWAPASSSIVKEEGSKVFSSINRQNLLEVLEALGRNFDRVKNGTNSSTSPTTQKKKVEFAPSTFQTKRESSAPVSSSTQIKIESAQEGEEEKINLKEGSRRKRKSTRNLAPIINHAIPTTKTRTMKKVKLEDEVDEEYRPEIDEHESDGNSSDHTLLPTTTVHKKSTLPSSSSTTSITRQPRKAPTRQSSTPPMNHQAPVKRTSRKSEPLPVVQNTASSSNQPVQSASTTTRSSSRLLNKKKT